MSAKKKRPPGPAAAPSPIAPPATEPATSWLSLWALGPIAAVRPYLVVRVVLWILAIDVWSTHLGAAWRYGTAGFNVAHFGWMNALPIPTAEAYVGMLALLSVGAAVAASLAEPPRWLLASIAALYLWGWSSSMHDSYQHHYLISWLLLTFAASPPVSATAIYGEPSRGRRSASDHWLSRLGFATLPHGPTPRTHAWGYRWITLLGAVVYGYTAVSKLEPDWRSGDALQLLTRGGEGMEAPLGALERFGIHGADAWPVMGALTIAIQITVSLAYLVAPLADADVDDGAVARRGRGIGFLMGAALPLIVGGLIVATLEAAGLLGAVGIVVGLLLGSLAGRALWSELAPARALVAGVARGLGAVGLVAAIAFHLGAEAMGLEIGWFSFYMIALAIVVLGPVGWLGGVTAVLTSLSRESAAALARTEQRTGIAPLPVLGAAMVAVVALAALGDYARVPGAFAGLVMAGVALLAVAVLALLTPAHRRTSLVASGAALVCAGLVALSLSRTAERYDYFRFAGGDFRRRGEVARALAAYREALPFAPLAEDRERIEGRIEELEAFER